MNVLFEDEGELKLASVLAESEASLQVETLHGRRLKVKSANVLLRFATPSAAAAMEQARTLAAELDPGFLWEASGEAEFGFADLAGEYYGRAPTPAESVAVAMCLHASPMHFRRRGRGRFRAAPEAELKAALAGAERKRQQAATIAGWVEQLARRELPEALRAALPMLLYAPDRNALEHKALAQACEAARTTPVKLLAECGAIPSTHDYHFNRFLHAQFPRGTGFGEWGAMPEVPELPLAEVEALSIDDAETTEIDDAFSVRALPDGGHEIGIHIAAPGAAIAPGSRLAQVARARLSTVYMPGHKITMLPAEVVERFTLGAGRECPALSLYVTVGADDRVLATRSRVERVRIVSNLRHSELDDGFASDPEGCGLPHAADLHRLWRLAGALEKARGKEEVERVDYTFVVEGERVRIEPRIRGSALDKLVAELMILANTTWAGMLARTGVPGMYRVQQSGKVRMSTQPAPHEGIGAACYVWATSPLRRYADLVNQWQIMAVLDGRAPPFRHGDAGLFAAAADFEATYAAYAEFQAQMEHYWCLRWLLQEGIEEVPARVIRENLVRFELLPIVTRVADAPALPGGTPVRVGVGNVDLLAASFEARFRGALEKPPEAVERL